MLPELLELSTLCAWLYKRLQLTGKSWDEHVSSRGQATLARAGTWPPQTEQAHPCVQAIAGAAARSAWAWALGLCRSLMRACIFVLYTTCFMGAPPRAYHAQGCMLSTCSPKCTRPSHHVSVADLLHLLCAGQGLRSCMPRAAPCTATWLKCSEC